MIARLRSPHTVDLFDFGVAADGGFYYVMELLEGLDAETLVRRTGPVPAARAIYLLRQVCHSLSEAESCGLVHRDIKPANIFLCRYGEEFDFVKVLDFGIVKPTHDTAETGVALTRELSVHGTPAYIAPEQALGAADLDGRADIYATGCVGVLAADRPARVRRSHTDGAAAASHADAAGAAFGADRAADSRTRSIASSCRASPRTAPSGRNRRASCRACSRRSRARTTGPRTWRGSGGRHTGRRDRHERRGLDLRSFEWPSKPPRA